MPKAAPPISILILQACVFEIVSMQVEEVPVPEWVFAAFGQPVEKRNFRDAEITASRGPAAAIGG